MYSYSHQALKSVISIIRLMGSKHITSIRHKVMNTLRLVSIYTEIYTFYQGDTHIICECYVFEVMCIHFIGIFSNYNTPIFCYVSLVKLLTLKSVLYHLI